MPVADSQGTTFIFAGTEYYLTNIKVKKTGKGYDQDVDVSTLDLDSGDLRVYESPPLYDYGPAGLATEITISFLGFATPDLENAGALECEKFGLSSMARCTEVEVEGAVGEKIKGTATFVIKG